MQCKVSRNVLTLADKSEINMKSVLIPFLAVALAGPAYAHDGGAGHATGSPATSGGAVRGAPLMVGLGRGVGVVKEMNLQEGSVTLKHGPIGELGWPAMTMKFKIEPSLLEGVKLEQSVKFSLRANGGSAEIISLTPN